MLKIAVQMDPIASINPAGDSTFAMMLEGQNRKHKLDYYLPSSLALRDNRVSAEVAPIRVFDKPKGEHFKLGKAKRADLGAYDVVLMRQDPPFDMNYMTLTHMLERIHPKTFVVECAGVGAQCAREDTRHRVPRAHAADAGDARPRTDPGVPQGAWQHHREALYGNGGAGVFFIEEGSQNLTAAARTVRECVPRALHGAALSAGGAAGRQTHHPHRWQGGGRSQPRTVGR